MRTVQLVLLVISHVTCIDFVHAREDYVHAGCVRDSHVRVVAGATDPLAQNGQPSNLIETEISRALSG